MAVRLLLPVVLIAGLIGSAPAAPPTWELHDAGGSDPTAPFAAVNESGTFMPAGSPYEDCGTGVSSELDRELYPMDNLDMLKKPLRTDPVITEEALIFEARGLKGGLPEGEAPAVGHAPEPAAALLLLLGLPLGIWAFRRRLQTCAVRVRQPEVPLRRADVSI